MSVTRFLDGARTLAGKNDDVIVSIPFRVILDSVSGGSVNITRGRVRDRIVEDFTGYPDGTDASRRLLRAGEEVEVPDDFAEIVVAKGREDFSHSSQNDRRAVQPQISHREEEN